jgi:hypothetical protein
VGARAGAEDECHPSSAQAAAGPAGDRRRAGRGEHAGDGARPVAEERDHSPFGTIRARQALDGQQDIATGLRTL